MEQWLKKNSHTAYFCGFVFFVLSCVGLNLQFPQELRGGVMSRLEKIAVDYSNRDEALKKDVQELSQRCSDNYAIVQSQLEAMHEMRNDVYPPR